jgi:FkbM family methyltransferase
MAKRPLVYDLGMNNGDDTEYYLTKGYRVVAVEANIRLCAEVERRFADAIDDGRLEVLNLALADQEGEIEFYVNTRSHVKSTIFPQELESGLWEKTVVRARRFTQVLDEKGPEPEYIKIDVEGFDAKILSELHRAGIRPKYISAEAHTVDTYCHLVAMGYQQFKLVAGESVHKDYADTSIEALDGTRQSFRFRQHSAGPFGDDIRGPWLDKNQILWHWLGRATLYGPSWFDIHARR